MKQHPEIVKELQDFAPTLASLQGRGCPFIRENSAAERLAQFKWVDLECIQAEEGFTSSKMGAWTVPENYWQNFEKELWLKIQTSQKSEWANMDFPLKGAFNTPENYFDQLASIVLEKAAITKAPSPEQIFQTPEGYFETFETKLFEKINTSEKVNTKTFLVQWRNVAVAAVLVGVIFSAIWFLKAQNASIGATPVPTTAMNEQQVQEYVQEQASEAEIQKIIEANDQEASQEEELQKLLSNPEKPKTQNKKAEVEEYISNEIDESTLTELL